MDGKGVRIHFVFWKVVAMKRIGDSILTLFSFDPKRRNFDHVMDIGGVGFKVQNDQRLSIGVWIVNVFDILPKSGIYLYSFLAYLLD